jgi:hypothetical protein
MSKGTLTMNTKTPQQLLDDASPYDVLPVSKLRMILSPPRIGNDLADPTLYAVYCPNHNKIEVIEDQLDKFPALIRCNGHPFVVTLGQGIFVGSHLLVPSARPRLLTVLQGIYGDDALLGNNRRWVEHPGVKRTWQPISPETLAELRGADAFGRAKAPPVSHDVPCKALEPELAA